MKKIIGIVDADLLDNGTRHPNLVCLKLAGWYRAQGDTVLLIDSWEDLLYHAKNMIIFLLLRYSTSLEFQKVFLIFTMSAMVEQASLIVLLPSLQAAVICPQKPLRGGVLSELYPM